MSVRVESDRQFAAGSAAKGTSGPRRNGGILALAQRASWLRRSGGKNPIGRKVQQPSCERPAAGPPYRALAFLIPLVTLTSPVAAEEAAFGFVNTTDLLPKGGKEVEQWVTWRHQKNFGSFDLVQGETEIEYGVLDNLQVALGANYAWNQAFKNGPFGVRGRLENGLVGVSRRGGV